MCFAEVHKTTIHSGLFTVVSYKKKKKFSHIQIGPQINIFRNTLHKTYRLFPCVAGQTASVSSTELIFVVLLAQDE